ncbi:PIM3 kinase, partial [Cercotrichas coryphoeus]|nr:PIM3 kinase [Cercotrichas coryphoeus]
RHCTSCRVLHSNIKTENILLDLTTGQLKLIDCGCGTFLQDSLHPHPPDELHLYFIGTPSYSPLEWTHFGWCYGKPATFWSLGIL